MSSVLFGAVQLNIMSATENLTSLLFCRVLFILLCYWYKYLLSDLCRGSKMKLHLTRSAK